MVGSRPSPDLAELRIDDRSRGGAPRRRWVVPVVLVLALVAVAAVASFALGRPPRVEIAVARASGTAGAPSALLNASGYVTPRRRATVAAKVTGRVEQIDAEEGMEVEAGQVLARLDDSDARRRLAATDAARAVAAASLRDLEVNLAHAERDLVRAEELERRGGRSR